ncbi:hypothetical protein ACJZ2D_011169 [Fusarium nematophilum]
MRTIFFVTALLSTAARAQSADVLPKCAASSQTCALAAISRSGCAETDAMCVCKFPGFSDALSSCIINACSPEDAAAAIATGNQLCAAAGVTIPGPSAVPRAVSAPPDVDTVAATPAPPVVPTGSAEAPTAVATPPVVPTAGAGMLEWSAAGLASIGLSMVLVLFM